MLRVPFRKEKFFRVFIENRNQEHSSFSNFNVSNHPRSSPLTFPSGFDSGPDFVETFAAFQQVHYPALLSLDEVKVFFNSFFASLYLKESARITLCFI
jgi:hypothetical protein